MLSAIALCRLSLVGGALLASRAVLAQAPIGPADEVREYEVLVKQKPVGRISTWVTEAQDGTTVAVIDTAVEAEFFLIKYRYEFHGKETWQGDRLVRLESHTNDNGKLLAVSAAVDSNGSRIDVKSKPVRSGPVLAMTSNYWRLPNAELAAGKLSIIDSDTGAILNVRFQRVGPDSLVIDGRRTACEHYRVSGDTAAELWFDGQRRLIRQQTVEQGYPTELRLARIRGNPVRE
jgi:hypothetical protein